MSGLWSTLGTDGKHKEAMFRSPQNQRFKAFAEQGFQSDFEKFIRRLGTGLGPIEGGWKVKVPQKWRVEKGWVDKKNIRFIEFTSPQGKPTVLFFRDNGVPKSLLTQIKSELILKGK